MLTITANSNCVNNNFSHTVSYVNKRVFLTNTVSFGEKYSNMSVTVNLKSAKKSLLAHGRRNLCGYEDKSTNVRTVGLYLERMKLVFVCTTVITL